MKKLLTLLGTAFLAFATLTACNSGGDSNDNGGDDDNKVQGESLPFSQTQASQKILELGATRGFEITYNTKIGDATGTETDTVTLGYKNDVLWIAGVFAYKKGPTGSIIAYHYDETTHQYSGGYDLASIGAQWTDSTKMIVNYKGPLSGLLDEVSNRFGVWWKYEKKEIYFYRYIINFHENSSSVVL